MKIPVFIILIVLFAGCQTINNKEPVYDIYHVNSAALKEYEGIYRASAVIYQTKNKKVSVDLSKINVKFSYDEKSDKMEYEGSFAYVITKDSSSSTSIQSTFSGTMFSAGKGDSYVNFLKSGDSDEELVLNMYFTNKGVILNFVYNNFSFGSYNCHVQLKK